MLRKNTFAIIKLQNYQHIEAEESRPPLELIIVKGSREKGLTAEECYADVLSYLYPEGPRVETEWESTPVEEPAHMYSEYIQYSFDGVQPAEFSMKVDVNDYQECWWIRENAGIEQYLFLSEENFLLIRSENLS